MSLQAVFNGVTYSIPEKGEVGWFDLSNYLFALSGAATTSAMTYSSTNVTAATYTATGTDMTLLVNVAAPTTITFPTGSDGRFLLVVDKSGLATTNNITIVGTAQTVNGSSYIIHCNNGTALFQFDTTSSDWKLITEIKFLDDVKVVPDTNSTSFLYGYPSHALSISDDLGRSLLITSEFASTSISCIADKNNIFKITDVAGYYISKAINSNTIVIKNNTGGARTLQLRRI